MQKTQFYRLQIYVKKKIFLQVFEKCFYKLYVDIKKRGVSNSDAPFILFKINTIRSGLRHR